MAAHRVSIIIPNFNHGKFLDCRMESILSQTYSDYEVIILDDKSSDNSAEIIEKYRKNSHVSRIVYNEENSGSAFKQWDKGMSLADGELIWIAESDDFCDHDILEHLISAFDDDPSCTLAFCRSDMIYGGASTGTVFPYQAKLTDDFVMDGDEFNNKYQKHLNYVVNASSAVFKKKAACQVDQSFLNFKGLGDMLFWLDIASQGTVHYFSKPMNKFRQHITSQTAVLAGSFRQIEESINVRKTINEKKKLFSKWEYYNFKGSTAYRIKKSDILTKEEQAILLEQLGYSFTEAVYVCLKNIFRRIKGAC